MGSSQSSDAGPPPSQKHDTGGKTHIGNYMQKQIRKWEQAKESAETEDPDACGCQSEAPRMQRPYMADSVEEWTKMHAAIE